MTTETGKLPAMVEEGLAYFDGAGDAGDKLYVKAIREHIEALARDRAAQGEAEPIGWVFQHGETGRMSFSPNDGINTPDVFVRLNPSYELVCPAYTRPPVAGDAVLAMRALAASEWRRIGRDDIAVLVESYTGTQDEAESLFAAMASTTQVEGPPAGDAQARTARAIAAKGRHCGDGCDESNCCMDPGPAGDAQARVERVAKAIFEDQCPEDKWASPMSEEERESWRECARLAIAALQEKQ